MDFKKPTITSYTNLEFTNPVGSPIDKEFEGKWKTTIDEISEAFGEPLDIQAIIFIIGLQELNKGFRKYSKDQKLEIMHIAICTLLTRFGYYKFEGHDDDGWPHFSATEKLPFLKPGQQLRLMKEAIIDYFEKGY